jgi:hypothetical protein
MVRRALVLCLVVALGLSAGAGSASAHEFHSELGLTYIQGSGTTVFENAANSSTIKCGSTFVAGTMTKAVVPQLEVQPEYTKCTSTVTGGPVEVLAFDCDYIWSGETGVEAHGKFSIACPTPKKMELRILGTTCVASFGAQTSAQGVSYTNEGVGTGRQIKANVTATSLVYETSGFCTPYFGNGKDGRLTAGATTISGINPGTGKQAGIWFE